MESLESVDSLVEPGCPPETRIHGTAIVDPRAELDTGVSVGPYAVIGSNVYIGAGSTVGPHAFIERNTTVGRDCRIGFSAVLGTDPQDLKYKGERTELVIGDHTVIREFATLNRGTAVLGRTRVGSDCLLMAYTHVAHDCQVGDHVILSNAVNMAGHVQIEDWAVIGGVTPIHQFVRIGTHAFVGGGSRVAKDVPPYCRVAGSPARLYGLNTVGLERRGVPAEVRRELKRAYRLFFQSKLNVSQALERAVAELQPLPEVQHLLEFIRRSERGITI
ncbi:MAG: acyl-ACP--UDP-N-acetylglucosamine O-acyltransferase [Gemmatimonadetes bacterium]|nr:acyl-ACP--UDP-N-acetylglucosamine O-acyltransferase [Gemmatimonadota bacterium]